MPRIGLEALAIPLLLVAGSAVANADPAHICRVVQVEITPGELKPKPDSIDPTTRPQIVAWLEDPSGLFVGTLFITQATGRFGLGNRPGIMEFNSDFGWPYGRRETVFPIWAHRHGMTYPRLIFQDGYDRDLSHSFAKSSKEAYYCRPLRSTEMTRQSTIDANSCATVVYTDKGKFDPNGAKSLYPPRSDVRFDGEVDSRDASMFATLNDLDAVSRATPLAGAPFAAAMSVPSTLPDGQFVLFVEASSEFDQNDQYDFPSPGLAAYGEYGLPYRGQPSILWRVPITVDNDLTVAHSEQVLDYEGYGDPTGATGDVGPAHDGTITENGAEGSGVNRLLIASNDKGTYRVRVTSTATETTVLPGKPSAMEASVTSPSTATVTFSEPDGPVSGFDVRVSAGTPITVDTFDTVGRPVSVNLKPAGAGALQTVNLTRLLPETHYWVGIRAHDSCLEGGEARIVELETARLENGEVSACFVATAAFGSPMQADVTLLRAFRDRILKQSAIGEIFVETYYTFGPALAGAIRPSDTLRAIVRAALAPVVGGARLLLE